MRPWNKSLQCYLMLDVFRSGTMEVEKRKCRTQYVHIKYFEASWPGALVAHRIQPHARIYERTYENIAKISASTLKATHPCCTI